MDSPHCITLVLYGNLVANSGFTTLHYLSFVWQSGAKQWIHHIALHSFSMVIQCKTVDSPYCITLVLYSNPVPNSGFTILHYLSFPVPNSGLPYFCIAIWCQTVYYLRFIWQSGAKQCITLVLYGNPVPKSGLP